MLVYGFGPETDKYVLMVSSGPETNKYVLIAVIGPETNIYYLWTLFGPVKYEIFNLLSSHLRFNLSMMSDCTLNLFGGGSGGGLWFNTVFSRYSFSRPILSLSTLRVF